MGEVLIAILQSPDFTDLITLTIAPDEASARAAVDAQQAGVAVIIPANFTAALDRAGNPGDGQPVPGSGADDWSSDRAGACWRR